MEVVLEVLGRRWEVGGLLVLGWRSFGLRLEVFRSIVAGKKLTARPLVACHRQEPQTKRPHRSTSGRLPQARTSNQQPPNLTPKDLTARPLVACHRQEPPTNNLLTSHQKTSPLDLWSLATGKNLTPKDLLTSHLQPPNLTPPTS